MKGFYNIAGVNTYIEAPCLRLEKNAEKFKSTSEEKQAEIILTNQRLVELNGGKTDHLEELAYMASGSLFHRRIIKHGGIMLHSSAIIYNGRGLAFSAPSGTGKSTHTALWNEKFKENCAILNDDKPVIKKENGCYYIYGTPWSGKSDININAKAPLDAIVLLERGEKDEILSCDKNIALKKILEATVHPKNLELLNLSLEIIEDILKNVKIYTLKCTPKMSAVEEVLKVI